jgi:hypothetical protein
MAASLACEVSCSCAVARPQERDTGTAHAPHPSHTHGGKRRAPCAARVSHRHTRHLRGGLLGEARLLRGPFSVPRGLLGRRLQGLHLDKGPVVCACVCMCVCVRERERERERGTFESVRRQRKAQGGTHAQGCQRPVQSPQSAQALVSGSAMHPTARAPAQTPHFSSTAASASALSCFCFSSWPSRVCTVPWWARTLDRASARCAFSSSTSACSWAPTHEAQAAPCPPRGCALGAGEPIMWATTAPPLCRVPTGTQPPPPSRHHTRPRPPRLAVHLVGRGATAGGRGAGEHPVPARTTHHAHTPPCRCCYSGGRDCAHLVRVPFPSLAISRRCQGRSQVSDGAAGGGDVVLLLLDPRLQGFHHGLQALGLGRVGCSPPPPTPKSATTAHAKAHIGHPQGATPKPLPLCSCRCSVAGRAPPPPHTHTWLCVATPSFQMQHTCTEHTCRSQACMHTSTRTAHTNTRIRVGLGTLHQAPPPPTHAPVERPLEPLSFVVSPPASPCSRASCSTLFRPSSCSNALSSSDSGSVPAPTVAGSGKAAPGSGGGGTGLGSDTAAVA